MDIRERIALENCRDHWQWMADNPSRFKEDYFHEKGLPLVTCDCYLCEYMCFSGYSRCHLCPLTGIAWEERCEKSNSYFQEWRNVHGVNNHISRKWALKMVDACELALLKV